MVKFCWHSSIHLSRVDAIITRPSSLSPHSMGDIIFKKVLILAKQDPNYHKLAARIHSMFFLATPHCRYSAIFCSCLEFMALRLMVIT